MGNCSTSRRKIRVSQKQGISTAIRNVVIDDISEGKQLRRCFSKGNVLYNSNINVNNFNLTNNEKEKNILYKSQIDNADKNKMIKSKSKSKEKIINDFNLKNYYSYNSNINRDNNSYNNKVKNIPIKSSTTVNV